MVSHNDQASAGDTMKTCYWRCAFFILALFADNVAVAEPPALSFTKLPAEIRSLAQDTRKNCKAQGDEGAYRDMQGISAISFEDGSRGVIVDNEGLCNSWIPGGNCSNRGCDLTIWRHANGAAWRKVFSQHAYRKWISLDDDNTLKLIAISVGATRPECHPVPGKQYMSSQSCDALVHFQNGRWLWKVIQTPQPPARE
jgi:hypothetical protein